MIAPMVLDGPINGEPSQAYVDQVLVPELRRGIVVIMANLSSHRARALSVPFRPPVGPCSTSRPTPLIPTRFGALPRTQAFAKLKSTLRRSAERTIAGLWATIGRVIQAFTPAKCANYFAATGYDAD
jgi:hypothetical protein